jgi:hypothetical protein
MYIAHPNCCFILIADRLKADRDISPATRQQPPSHPGSGHLPRGEGDDQEGMRLSRVGLMRRANQG